MDRVIPVYPPYFVAGGKISINHIFCLQCFDFTIPIQGTVAFYIHERPIYVSDFMCKMPQTYLWILFLRDDHSRENDENKMLTKKNTVYSI